LRSVAVATSVTKVASRTIAVATSVAVTKVSARRTVAVATTATVTTTVTVIASRSVAVATSVAPIASVTPIFAALAFAFAFTGFGLRSRFALFALIASILVGFRRERRVAELDPPRHVALFGFESELAHRVQAVSVDKGFDGLDFVGHGFGPLATRGGDLLDQDGTSFERKGDFRPEHALGHSRLGDAHIRTPEVGTNKRHKLLEPRLARGTTHRTRGRDQAPTKSIKTGCVPGHKIARIRLF
jgi:hypothetical protein